MVDIEVPVHLSLGHTRMNVAVNICTGQASASDVNNIGELLSCSVVWLSPDNETSKCGWF